MVEAALELMEAGGEAGFTLRKLGTRVGCDPMSILYHFKSKEGLYRAMAGRLESQLRIVPASLPWRGRMRHLADQYRSLALRFPKSFWLMQHFVYTGPADYDHMEMVHGALREAGIEIETLDEAELKRLGMNALLAVGSASMHPPRIVVLRYRGKNGSDAPLAFVGKGVCFDAGGLCIKTGPQMFDMKGDMAGAAAVAGLLLALARQGSKVDAVGVLGIAENMLSGKSYKSGDVITTLSGQTVEVFDTDCEGRMLLADCLYYTATRFKPSAIVDLATLTYSVMRGLGSIFAGLFSTDDTIASGMIAAGEAVGERFWRMPLDHAYDEGLQSPLADLRQHARNLEDGDAPYAAAFLRHFTDNRPWVHLDIAGKELSETDGPMARQGGVGFGVQMLERWVGAVEAGNQRIGEVGR